MFLIISLITTFLQISCLSGQAHAHTRVHAHTHTYAQAHSAVTENITKLLSFKADPG